MKTKKTKIGTTPFLLKSYPKYQYSLFLKNSREEQVVIRADNWEDFLDAKKNVDKIVGKREAESQPTPPPYVADAPAPVQAPAQQGFCNTHNVPMAQAISKKTGKPYWYHKNEQGQMCFGRGFQ